LGTWGVAWQETEEIYYDVTFSEQAAHALWGSVQKSDWTRGLTYASLLELVKAGLLKKQENAYSLHRLFLEDAIQRWQAESDEQTRQQAEFWYRKLPWWPELESWFSISFILLTILLWFLLTIVNLFLLESFRLLILMLLAVIMVYIAYPGIRDLQEIRQKQDLNYLRRKTDTVALVLLELQRAKARLNVDNYGMMKKLQEVEKRAIRLVEIGLGIVVLIIILPGGLFLYRTTFNLNWIENGPELGKWRNVIVGSLYFVLTIGTGFTSVGLMLRSKLLSLPSKLRNRLREQST
jgi:hypothetical protein